MDKHEDARKAWLSEMPEWLSSRLVLRKAAHALNEAGLITTAEVNAIMENLQ